MYTQKHKHSVVAINRFVYIAILLFKNHSIHEVARYLDSTSP